MVEFETVHSEEIRFGDDQFLEVARKRAISGEGADEYVSLASGRVEDGEKRYKSNFAVPAEEEVVRFLVEHLPKMLDGGG